MFKLLLIKPQFSSHPKIALNFVQYSSPFFAFECVLNTNFLLFDLFNVFFFCPVFFLQLDWDQAILYNTCGGGRWLLHTDRNRFIIAKFSALIMKVEQGRRLCNLFLLA